MSRPIGYYVHHHGDGHRQRAIAIAKVLASVTLLGTGLRNKTHHLPNLDLPDDRLDEGFAGADGADRPSSLHYAPFDHDGIRKRTAMIAAWIADVRPRLMVVDVSAEVAMLARLASVPTVYVRLNGNRFDAAHLDAFRAADALLAPFHAVLDDDAVPAWVREKTFYAPGIVGSAPTPTFAGHGVTLVVLGRGSGASSGEKWVVAARATPERKWRVIGPCSAPISGDIPPNLQFRGWVDDAIPQIARAGVVIGSAGDGVVSAVLAARRPFICLPEARPFDEQISKAKRLAAMGRAVVRYDWPRPFEWTGIIGQAINQCGGWPACLDASVGPKGVAAWLNAMRTTKFTERGHFA